MRATHSSLPLLFLLLIISYEVGAKEEQPLLKSGYTIAYSSDKSGEFEIYLSGSDGKSKARITSPPESGGGYLAWSPNGKALAFYKKYDERKTWSIHTISNDGSDWKRLTHSKGVWDHSPTWSPDGKKIAFGRTYKNSDGIVQNEIWLMSAQGNEQVKSKDLVVVAHILRLMVGSFITPNSKVKRVK